MQLSLHRQGQAATIIVVVVGFFITFSAALAESPFPFSATDLVIGIGAGLVYLLLELESERFFAYYPSPQSTAIFFLVQIALILTVQWFLFGYLIWIIALPLVSTAVEQLSPYWRWPVYVTPIIGIVLALGPQNGDPQLIWSLSLSAATAIIFVIVFTQQRVNEQAARERAEQLTNELETANQQLSAYAVQAEELATMAERNRLAREIHDNLGHYLTVVNVQLEAARAVMAENPDKAQDAINKAQGLTQKGLTAVRQSVRALRESPLGNRPLAEAITNLVHESQSTGILAQFSLNGEPHSLPADTELTLYRVAQEGLTNIRKHAQAQQATVGLTYQPHQVQLAITDDGIGTAEPQPNGFGLIGIHERISQLGGTVQIDTAVQQGFSLIVTIPVNGKQ